MHAHNEKHLSGKRNCLAIAALDSADPTGHFGHYPCKKIKTEQQLQQNQDHDHNQPTARSAKALCLESTSCLRRDFPADTHALQEKINNVIKPGNLADGIPQDELWTHYDAELDRRLKTSDLSRAQYDIWQQKARGLNLEVDPVITELSDHTLSDHMLELQTRFLEQGRESFACKEFHIVVRNMQRCLAAELINPSEITKAELEKFSADLTACQQSVEIPFRELLPLVIRFIVMFFVLNETHNPDTVPSEDSPGDDSVNDILTKESVARLLREFNTITFERLIDDPLLPATIAREMLGYDLIYDSDLSALKSYLDKQYPYLPWFCFDELPAEFFMKAARYRICAVGLLAMPFTNADHCLMNNLDHPLHDMKHATSSLTQLSPDEQAVHHQQVLETLEAALKQIHADTETAYAIRFALSYSIHDSFGRGKPFGGILGISNMIEDIIKSSRMGAFPLPTGVRVAHFTAAELFWSFWYPEPVDYPLAKHFV